MFSPLPLRRKRPLSTPPPTPKRPRLPSPPSSQVSSPAPSQVSFADCGSLPDEILVSIFRYIAHASNLAALRTVCRQWCHVIDHSPSVWRTVSFRYARFTQPVVSFPRLCLGPRSGRRAVTIAARSGNQWAAFVKAFLFDRRVLRAVTTAQPLASMLVAGKTELHSQSHPPWTPDSAGCGGAWLAVHASRSPTTSALPSGAVVGIVHVRQAVMKRGQWIWSIDRAVSLKKPIRCAGFVGLWPVSSVLTEILVNAMQNQ